MAKGGISLDLTQLALIFGGGAILYYMYITDLPPFNSLPKFDLTNTDRELALGDEDTTDPNDVIPGKGSIAYDFTKGGSSGSLEEDFFRVLERQKSLLNLPFGYQGNPQTVGDPELPTVGTQTQAAQDYGLSGIGPIVFDNNGNPIVIPVANQGTATQCNAVCHLKCDQLYQNGSHSNSVCKSSCGSICGSLTSGRAKISYKARSAIKANRRMKLMKDTVDRQIDALREKRPKRQVIGIKVQDPESIDFENIIATNMRLRPLLMSSHGEMHLLNNVANS